MVTKKLNIDEILRAAAACDLRLIPISSFLNCQTSADSDTEDDDVDELVCDPGSDISPVKVVKPKSKREDESSPGKNPISQLHEYCAGILRCSVPDFRFSQTADLQFSCTATVTSYTKAKFSARALATKKQEAKTLASKALLLKLQKGITTADESDKEGDNKENNTPPRASSKAASTSSSESPVSHRLDTSGESASLLVKTFGSKVNEYCQKNRLPTAEFEFVQKLDGFHCTTVIDHCKGHGVASQKKAAKEKACEDVLRQLLAKQ